MAAAVIVRQCFSAQQAVRQAPLSRTKSAAKCMTVAAALMIWSSAAVAELSCKEFRHGYVLGDPDILRLMARIATPLILAENGGTMPGDRTAAFREVALRLQFYCDQLPDDSVDAIVASMLKTAPEQYAAAVAKQAEEKAATEKAAAEKVAAERKMALAGSKDPSNLSAAQRNVVGDFVRRCWAADPTMLDLDKMEVRLTVTTDGSGVVRRANVAPEDTGRVTGNMRLREFSERAVRAVMDPNCANLPLPPPMLGADAGVHLHLPALIS